jgi:hypothetical protein
MMHGVAGPMALMLLLLLLLMMMMTVMLYCPRSPTL